MERKLVLVLDLDHTLIHSKEKQASELSTKSRDDLFINLWDPLKSIYELRLYNFGY